MRDADESMIKTCRSRVNEGPYHFDRCISQINKGRRNFGAVCRVQRRSFPEGKNSANELRVALHPLAIKRWSSIYTFPLVKSFLYSRLELQQGSRTIILVIQLKEIAFLVDLVGVDIEIGEDRR